MRALSTKGMQRFLGNYPLSVRALRTAYSAFVSKPRAYRPLYVTFEVSNLCNLNCKMCIRNFINRKNELMDFETFKKVIDEIRPLYVGLTGYGEPLFNMDVFRMIKYAKEKNKKTIVKLFTNATLLNKERIYGLIDSGLDILNISLESPLKTNEKIRINSNITKITENLKLLNSAKKGGKPEVDINTVVMRDNLQDLPEMISLVHELNAKFTLAHMTIYGKNENKEMLPSKNGREKTHFYLEKARKRAESLGESEISKDIADYMKLVDKNWGKFAECSLFEDAACFVPWLTCYVASNGDVYPCCYFYEGSIKYGNINKNSFSEIWNSNAARKFRENMVKNGRNYAACTTCPENGEFLFKIFQKVPLKFLSSRKYDA